MDRRRFSRTLGLLALGAGLPARAAAPRVSVRVDRNAKYQTIEGFGFFGARDSWWGEARELASPEWARLVIDDLGLSMWRNEYYPPSDKIGGDEADADWLKQRPVMEAAQPGGRQPRAAEDHSEHLVGTGEHEMRLQS